MDGGVNAVLQQMSWHDGGLFMGMHWLWWLVSLGAFCLLAWAFVRLYADRAEIRRRANRQKAAEEALRQRFAEGEIDEDEFMQRMKALRETVLGG